MANFGKERREKRGGREKGRLGAEIRGLFLFCFEKKKERERLFLSLRPRASCCRSKRPRREARRATRRRKKVIRTGSEGERHARLSLRLELSTPWEKPGVRQLCERDEPIVSCGGASAFSFYAQRAGFDPPGVLARALRLAEGAAARASIGDFQRTCHSLRSGDGAIADSETVFNSQASNECSAPARTHPMLAKWKQMQGGRLVVAKGVLKYS